MSKLTDKKNEEQKPVFILKNEIEYFDFEVVKKVNLPKDLINFTHKSQEKYAIYEAGEVGSANVEYLARFEKSDSVKILK